MMSAKHGNTATPKYRVDEFVPSMYYIIQCRGARSSWPGMLVYISGPGRGVRGDGKHHKKPLMYVVSPLQRPNTMRTVIKVETSEALDSEGDHSPYRCWAADTCNECVGGTRTLIW
jgi:hypothetical protein